VRLAWDVLRNVIDTLKNANKLERCYKEVVFKAFAFCREFNRTTEFRKLCGQLRQHLKQWRVAQEGGGERWVQETMELHMDTRFRQLETCGEFEMWSEAFRTAEDILAIKDMTGVAPRAQLMAAFYDKLAAIFWVSENYLYHACARYRFYTVSVAQNRGLTEEERALLGAQLTAAVLVVPAAGGSGAAGSGSGGGADDDRLFKADADKERRDRIAVLLGFPAGALPTREGLLDELATRGIARGAAVDMGALLDVLSTQFAPLELVAAVAPALRAVAAVPRLAQYVPALERLAVARQLEQLARVFSVLRLDRFFAMIAGVSVASEDVEKLIVRAGRLRRVPVRIDHAAGCLRFGDDALDSDSARRQLSDLSTRLTAVCGRLAAAGVAAAADGERAAAAKRDAAFAAAWEGMDVARKAIADRLTETERRKEESERSRALLDREVRVCGRARARLPRRVAAATGRPLGGPPRARRFRNNYHACHSGGPRRPCLRGARPAPWRAP
jgi:translation initiation factor 3 subunit A